MEPALRREIMLDNYEHPMNRGLVEDDSYIKINTNNESCIDNLDIMYKIEDGKLVDIRFDGEACAISTSATSIMIKSLVGKTKDEIIKIVENYENMIDEKEYDSNLLGELIVYNEIYRQPNRKKCALLPFESVKKIIDKM
ncbi:MAG: SUF system NifU family Fe-S cluster assembly protein [Tenericutes bacterium]|nr:SUF system NifU family Fe-S cluster assembly protein [Mycoplasmatota bacterium]